MIIWSSFVQFLAMVLVTLAQAYGGSLGLAIITLSLVVRLALLPLTVRLARRAQLRQAQLKALEPQIERLKQRYRSNPQRLSEELTKLYAQHGYSLFDRASLLGGLVQLPILAGMYSAIDQGARLGGRFLWVADLAQPDLALAALAAALTYVAGYLNPDLPQNARALLTLLPAVVTAVFLWRLASGLGLYWVTTSAVNLLQAAILRHTRAQV